MTNRLVSRKCAVRLWNQKNLCEILVGAVGFLIILPLFGLLALAVKVTSRGPVFYVSDRLGQGGRLFRLYKFRSMRMGVTPMLAPDGKVLTLKKDPRVTPIGAFLRLGFDELPQLINIIKGDMCLIGPRPDVPWELVHYTVRERQRLSVLPGITGLAQVVGGRYMNNAQNYELDVLYVERSTWRTDILILLSTLPYSLGMEYIGARIFPEYIEAVRPLGGK